MIIFIKLNLMMNQSLIVLFTIISYNYLLLLFN